MLNMHYVTHYLLAAYKYSCSYYNDWVIAFKIKENELIIYEIINSSLLF
jgi:mRNA-degrading endonuclease YafQ of YafQ-DinJ toxin-antitoxin module